MKGKKLLYIEVAKDLKSDILAGHYPVGTLIPTEIELEKKYEVSKITIRKAVEILSQEGYLEKKSGKGTTVISNRPFNKLSKATSFSAVLENEGHRLTKKIISVEEVDDFTELPEDVRKKLGERIICLTRIYYLDDSPYIFYKHYLPYKENIESLRKSQTSLYSWLGEQGQSISYIRDSFSIEMADEEIKEILNLDKPTYLKRHRYSFNQGRNLVEYSVGNYDVDLHSYVIEYEV
ncbi:GntR family transcriptional regulator [Vagococcus elongatus]|uniref:HTH gntR-type domain-containing protein n=1 Tax=Vagococcus elongatus TaxID=180344 RepID=A0A430AZR5_9ENTE|nr:GntR family transcriptional regulator [Vagococcus elongatus]RSU13570.1 hypothetical protein CBF29_04775 [Vagococcus elongatus]